MSSNAKESESHSGLHCTAFCSPKGIPLISRRTHYCFYLTSPSNINKPAGGVRLIMPLLHLWQSIGSNKGLAIRKFTRAIAYVGVNKTANVVSEAGRHLALVEPAGELCI